MIITLCGGGSTFTPGIVKSIALRKDELDVDEIRLYDINEERQRKIGVLVDWILHEDLGLDIKLTVTTDKKTAFTDASFVFAQMRVGGYAMREQDEKIPLRHGCVGQETCGCGGLAYGMRTIFPMVELIDDVEKYAKKDYWILNYSNPAAIVSEGCRVLRPNARIINICDMPIAIIDVVCAALDIDKKDVEYDYFGLNEYEIMECFPEYLPNTYLNYYLQQKEFVEHSNPERTRANEVEETREKNLFDGIDHYEKTGEIDESTFYAGSHGDWIADLAIA